jgi:hypothetical protein
MSKLKMKKRNMILGREDLSLFKGVFFGLYRLFTFEHQGISSA